MACEIQPSKTTFFFKRKIFIICETLFGIQYSKTQFLISKGKKKKTRDKSMWENIKLVLVGNGRELLD